MVYLYRLQIVIFSSHLTSEHIIENRKSRICISVTSCSPADYQLPKLFIKSPPWYYQVKEAIIYNALVGYFIASEQHAPTKGVSGISRKVYSEKTYPTSTLHSGTLGSVGHISIIHS